jgi:predicted SnoaL-like aldol condensation-catalyzing enzyme
MGAVRKERIRTLLKGIETGDPTAVEAVNQAEYIQHNPQTHEGSEGLAALFARLSKTSPRVNLVRVFADGDYVFAHTEYDFATRRIGFEVFRFEGEQAVEHWDNIQPRRGPNPSGHSMVDGTAEASDLSQTETNREFVREYVRDVLIEHHVHLIEKYVANTGFIQHNPEQADGVDELKAYLLASEGQRAVVEYTRLHRILAEGEFVLTACEGFLAGVPTAFYDLYRVERGSIVEHWDTIEAIPAKSEWKNSNGKF